MLIRKAGGFTVIEVLIALLIVVTLTAVMLPTVVTKVSNANSSTLAGNLQAINTAILQFRENTGRYPHKLTQLTTPPVFGDDDACGVDMPTSTRALWTGPYLSLSVGTNGIQSGDGVIANNMQRNPLVATSSTMSGVLQISAGAVTGSNANEVESVFDTGNDLDHGTITWIPTTGVIGTLTFSIPVRGC